VGKEVRTESIKEAQMVENEKFANLGQERTKGGDKRGKESGLEEFAESPLLTRRSKKKKKGTDTD